LINGAAWDESHYGLEQREKRQTDEFGFHGEVLFVLGGKMVFQSCFMSTTVQFFA